jgi:hypothetical protein
LTVEVRILASHATSETRAVFKARCACRSTVRRPALPYSLDIPVCALISTSAVPTSFVSPVFRRRSIAKAMDRP